jgi:hypothetical protein
MEMMDITSSLGENKQGDSSMENTPVQDAVIVEKSAEAKAEAPKVSPAKDLREIQALIANGIFPGNVAPSIVKAYNLLEQMALVVEGEAAAKDAK